MATRFLRPFARLRGRFGRLPVGVRLAGSAVVVIAVALGVHLADGLNHRTAATPAAIDSGTTAPTTDPVLKKATPTIATLTPAGKSADSLGGFYRVSPDGTDPVYAYVDHIGTVQVIVSEQTLPKSFLSDPDRQVRQLATNYNAEQQLTAGSTTAYIGTSENGPQSVILTKGGLLILLKSSAGVDNKSWSSYISSLQS